MYLDLPLVSDKENKFSCIQLVPILQNILDPNKLDSLSLV